MVVGYVSWRAFLGNHLFNFILFLVALLFDWQVGVPKILDGDMLTQFLELTSKQQEAILLLPLGSPDTVKSSLKPHLPSPIPVNQVVQLLERVHYALNWIWLLFFSSIGKSWDGFSSINYRSFECQMLMLASSLVLFLLGQMNSNHRFLKLLRTKYLSSCKVTTVKISGMINGSNLQYIYFFQFI